MASARRRAAPPEPFCPA